MKGNASLSHQRFVIATLNGGLGNNLFQYTAGLSVARHLDARLSFRFLRPTLSSAGLAALLGEDLELATPSMLRRFGLSPPAARPLRLVQRIRTRLDLSLGRVQVVRPGGVYEAKHSGQLRRDSKATLLNGCFQHPSWFDAALIETAGRLAERFEQVADPVLGSAATVISFRRGDYVQLGWDLTLDYYAKALDRLEHLDGPIWVIGDDQAFVQLFKLWLHDKGFVATRPPDLGVDALTQDLILLAFADQVIMSNSTFCWWGVVAGDPRGERTGRTVLVPAKWLPHGGQDALLRPEWQPVE